MKRRRSGMAGIALAAEARGRSRRCPRDKGDCEPEQTGHRNPPVRAPGDDGLNVPVIEAAVVSLYPRPSTPSR
jgi:hypothetical protein